MSATTALPIAIDTDPGVDDAMAIAMALASPEFEVRLVTSVFGNAATAITTRNAVGLLQLAGQSKIPVVRGLDTPMVAASHGPVPQVHGHDGLGDGGLLEGVQGIEPSGGQAATALIDAARQAATDGPRLTIVALGPLTNLALALRLEPALETMVERVVVMGGNALCPGNATPSAEANMLGDPEAADIVLGTRWPITMVGLDVTHRVNLTGSAIERIARADTFGGLIARKALPVYQAFFERTNGIDGAYVHDPSVMAWLLQPDLFKTARVPVRVETLGLSRGKTWPWFGATADTAPAGWRERPPVEVCIDVDGDAVAALVAARLSA